MKQHPRGGVCVQPNTLRLSVMTSLYDTLPKNVILAVYHNLGRVGKLYLINYDFNLCIYQGNIAVDGYSDKLIPLK